MPGLRSVWVPLRGRWDPRPPVGKAPGPRSRVRTQMGPEPALGLAIRPAAPGPRLRAGRGRGERAGLSLARGREASQGREGVKKRSKPVAVLPWGFRDEMTRGEQHRMIPQHLDKQHRNGAP